MSKKQSHLVSLKEAELILDVTERTLRRYVKKYNMTRWKIKRNVFLSRSEVVALSRPTILQPEVSVYMNRFPKDNPVEALARPVQKASKP